MLAGRMRIRMPAARVCAPSRAYAGSAAYSCCRSAVQHRGRGREGGRRGSVGAVAENQGPVAASLTLNQLGPLRPQLLLVLGRVELIAALAVARVLRVLCVMIEVRNWRLASLLRAWEQAGRQQRSCGLVVVAHSAVGVRAVQGCVAGRAVGGTVSSTERAKAGSTVRSPEPPHGWAPLLHPHTRSHSRSSCVRVRTCSGPGWALLRRAGGRIRMCTHAASLSPSSSSTHPPGLAY